MFKFTEEEFMRFKEDVESRHAEDILSNAQLEWATNTSLPFKEAFCWVVMLAELHPLLAWRFASKTRLLDSEGFRLNLRECQERVNAYFDLAVQVLDFSQKVGAGNAKEG